MSILWHRSSVRLLACVVTAAFLASCASSNVAEPSDPAPTLVPETSPTASPTPEPEPSVVYDEWGLGADGPEAQDAFGTWNRAVLADDAKALVFDPEQYDEDALDEYTLEEAEDAQELMAHFLATEFLDGVSLFDRSLEAMRAHWDNTRGFVRDNKVAQDDWRDGTFDTSNPGVEVHPAPGQIRRYHPKAAPLPYEPAALRFTVERFEFEKGYVDDLLTLLYPIDTTHAFELDGERHTISIDILSTLKGGDSYAACASESAWLTRLTLR